MTVRMNNTEAFAQLLEALQQADVVVQDESGDLAALRLTNQKVKIVIERDDGQEDDPEPWRGYCHLPFQLFTQLAAVVQGDIISVLDRIQYFIANAAEIESTFDEVLYGNYIEFVSREEAVEKLGFEWWK